MSYIGTSVANLPTAASNATVIAGTNTTQFLNAANVFFHRSVSSSACSFNPSDGAVDANSINVSSVSVDSTGTFTVTFTSAYVNTSYIVKVNALLTASTVSARVVSERNPQTTTCEVVMTDGLGIESATNVDRVIFAVSGVLA